jgi:small-conductance mechanosensitive channel
MNGRGEVQNLVNDLLADLQNITVLWQIGVLAACLLCAWQVSRTLRARVLVAQTSGGDAESTVKISVGGFNRLVFPLTALALLCIGRWVLERFYPVHLLHVAIALLFALALVRIVVYLLRQAFNPSGLIRQWERAIVWTVWIGLALHISGLLPDLIAFLEQVGFQFGKQRVSVLTILQGALSVGATLLLALWAARVIEGRLMRAHRLDPNLRAVFSKLAKSVLVIVAVLSALPLVGIDLTVLSVFGGALGVGIGLGLQKIAANYMSGFIILLDRSISLGALVTIDNRYGEVTKLTARYIVVKGLDGTEALIPNESVVSSTVINHSYSDRRARMDVPIQVSYQSDVDLALRLMMDAANGHARVIQDPQPVALLKEFADSGINLELFVWIDDPEKGKGNLRSELNLEIWRAFQANRIEIPFPQREVRIVSGPTSQPPL